MRRSTSPVRATVLTLVSLFLTLSGCSSLTGYNEDVLVHNVTVVTGANQSATAGQTLPVPISVRFTDIDGRPLAALSSFTWELVSAGGSLEAPPTWGTPPATPRKASADANRDGVITVKWTLSNRAGIDSLRLTGYYFYKGQQTYIQPLILTATVLEPTVPSSVR
jgi:hypothetical protein